MERKVLVTTEFRGVFAGEFVDQTDKRVVLENARMCVYWSSAEHGSGDGSGKKEIFLELFS